MTIDELIEHVENHQIHSVTLFYSKHQTARVTRQGKTNKTFLVTLDKPNYRARVYLKKHPEAVGSIVEL